MSNTENYKCGNLLMGKVVLLQGPLLDAGKGFDVIHDPQFLTIYKILDCMVECVSKSSCQVIMHDIW